MIALVTGAAGFVGSHLCEWLVEGGDEVRGVDCFTPYYDRVRKEANLQGLLGRARFTFVEGDLGAMSPFPLLEGVDAVYHLAGQPGVRPSWGAEFASYVRLNIEVTQRLLEGCRQSQVGAFLFASSSSVYGNAESYPTPETLRPRPVSPYGVTKLAAEHLCELYRETFGIPTASLRLFTVYGPRQRPDMAFSRLVEAAVRGRPFELFGDGTQTRDFTFVDDVVRAMSDAARSSWRGVANIGGGARTSMNEVIDIVREHAGSVDLVRRQAQPGDVRDTAADTTVARGAFGYAPRTSLREGLRRMIEWERVRQGEAA